MSAPISAFAKICSLVVHGREAGPSLHPLARASRRLYTTDAPLWGATVASTRGAAAAVAPARRGGQGRAYQLALRRPGTSPRMVAWRSMFRPRPNFE